MHTVVSDRILNPKSIPDLFLPKIPFPAELLIKTRMFFLWRSWEAWAEGDIHINNTFLINIKPRSLHTSENLTCYVIIIKEAYDVCSFCHKVFSYKIVLCVLIPFEVFIIMATLRVVQFVGWGTHTKVSEHNN